MSAPSSSPSRVDSELAGDPVTTAISKFSPRVLALFVLLPRWTYPLAASLWTRRELTRAHLNSILDTAVSDRLASASGILDQSLSQVSITPSIERIEPSTTGPMLRFAMEIGLVGPDEFALVSQLVEEQQNSTESWSEVELPLCDVVLRHGGIRFSSTAKVRVGQGVLARFNLVANESPMSAEISGYVVAVGGDDWTGRNLTVVFEPLGQSSPLADVLYHEFQLRPEFRQRVLSHLRGLGINLASDVAWLLENLGQLEDMPEAALLSLWRSLAGVANADWELTRQFDSLLKPLLDSGQTADAELMLSVASHLADLVGGTLETAVMLGQRRLELVYRRVVDQRSLQNYIGREDLHAEFDQLLQGEEGPWAIHFLGVGGAGKTMLMRYLTATYAERLPVSRVDFDFLSPNYPVRLPGQLLLELADGLRGFGSERSNDIFLKFQDVTASFHRELRSAPTPSDELSRLEGSGFDLCLDLFCDFVQSLVDAPVRALELRRVVLILDTCEELARLRPDGAFQPAVEATLIILHRVHQRLPFVRVVFAGRRLIAGRGPGWTAPEWLEANRLHPKSIELRDQIGLKLELVRGFDQASAIKLLERITGIPNVRGSRTLDAKIVDAILAASPETPLTLRVVGDQSLPSSETKGPFYNPFQLGLYADWFRDDPKLTAETIGSGRTDPYVEKRILGRLRNQHVEYLLPHLVLLRRADEALLRLILPRLDAATFGNVFRELCQLEWISYNTTYSGSAPVVFLEIERQLRPRIERCLSKAQLEHARDTLGSILPQLLRDEHGSILPTGRLASDHLEAAIRLLPVVEAEELWTDLERQVSEEAAWPWIRQICERLMAEDDASSPHSTTVTAKARPLAPPEILPHITATHISARERTSLVHRGVVSEWNGVSTLLEALPLSPVRSWVQHRARLGEIRARALAGDASEGGTFLKFGDAVRAMLDDASWKETYTFAQQLEASLLATADALLELAETTQPRFVEATKLVSVPQLAEVASLGPLRDLVGRRWARLYSFSGKFTPRSTASGPETTWSQLPGTPLDQFLDFPITSETTARIALEYIRELELMGDAISARRLLADQVHLRTTVPPFNSEESASGESKINSWAVSSVALRQQLQEAMPSPSLAAALVATSGQDAPWIPNRLSHRWAGPWTIHASEALLCMGRGAEALQALFKASAKQSDPDVVRAFEQQRLRIVRRLRLGNEALDLRESYRTAEEVEKRGTVWEVDQLVSASSIPPAQRWREPSDLRTLAIAWSGCEALRAGADWCLSQAKQLQPSSDRFLNEAFSSPAFLPGNPWFIFRIFECSVAQTKGFTTEPRIGPTETALLEALNATSFGRLWSAAWLAQPVTEDLLGGEITRRSSAMWALDEGELLALRWPKIGARLLSYSARVLRENGSNDAFMAFQASLCSVIASIHAGDIDSAVAELLLLRSSVNLLAEQHPGFPAATDWPALLKTRAGRREMLTSSHAAPAPELEPWIRRLSHAAEYCRIYRAEVEKLSFWIEQIERKYSETADGLPIEMQLQIFPRSDGLDPQNNSTILPKRTTDSGDQPFPPGPDPSPNPRKDEPSRIQTIVQGVFAVLIILAVVGLALAAPYASLKFGFRLFDDAPDPDRWKPAALLLPVFGLLEIFAVVFFGFRSIASIFVRRLEVRLVITDSAPHFFELNVSRLWDALFSVFPSALRPKPGGFEVVRARGEALHSEDMPVHLPKEICGVLGAWRKPLNNKFAGLALDLPKKEIEHPWESRVLSQEEGLLEPWSTYEPYRWAPNKATADPLTLTRRNTVFLITSHRWSTSLLTGWQVPGITALDVLPDWLQLQAFAQWPEQVRAMHFVGRPVLGPSGIGLIMSSGSEPNRALRKTPSAEEPQILPEIRGVDRVPLLIVQAEPSLITSLSSSDRRDARLLRTFCHALQLAGAPHVIMLPAIAPNISARVNRIIATNLEKITRIRATDILALTHSIREEIWSARLASGTGLPGLDVADLERLHRELALMVTVFIRHDFECLPNQTSNQTHHG